MSWLTGAELVVGLVLLLCAFSLMMLFLRRRWLSARGGVFDCDVRPADSEGATGWITGMARYDGDFLEWYRVFSISFRPKVVLPRAQSRLVARREAQGSELEALSQGASILRLTTVDAAGAPSVWELAASRGSLVGLMSWLEASPPGGATYWEHFSS